MDTSSLIIEIFTEELPFSGIKKEINNILPKFNAILQENKINAEVEFFWTARRLIFYSSAFPQTTQDEILEFFGPPLSIAYDNNKPTNATKSFLKKNNIELDDIQIRQKDGKDYLYYAKKKDGEKTCDLLEKLIMDLISSLHFGKSMYWGEIKTPFVRPIRNIIAILDDNFIALPTLSQKYQFNQTPMVISLRSQEAKIAKNAKEYFKILQNNGVIYEQNKRKAMIIKQIETIQENNQIQVEIDDKLLDEIIAITESPSALFGRFDEKFLELPGEVIITSMKVNQKYFATYKQNNLYNGFIVVCNTFEKDCFDEILKGNMRVLKARLEDALFFYHNDKVSFYQQGTDLKLKEIEYIENSGSVYDKVQREIAIAKILLQNTQYDENKIIRAISISKNDLLSEMVGEFGELQGIMGSYYTNDTQLKLCLKEQYLPLQEDSNLPSSEESAIVAIANKLDSILSLFALGKIPSGSKDPFALRRNAIGIIKIITTFGISFDIEQILESLTPQYKHIDKDKITHFFFERLESALGVNQSLINAAIKSKQNDLTQLCLQIKALYQITQSSDKDAFKSLFKRVANILKNTDRIDSTLNPSLFCQDEEKILYAKWQDFSKTTLKSPIDRIEKLLTFRESLQNFFDNVMINVEDEILKTNRILLVKTIYEEFFKVGDIREISF